MLYKDVLFRCKDKIKMWVQHREPQDKMHFFEIDTFEKLDAILKVVEAKPEYQRIDLAVKEKALTQVSENILTKCFNDAGTELYPPEKKAKKPRPSKSKATVPK